MFLHKRCRKSIEDAKFSSYLYLSAYMGFMLIGLICLSGIIKDNYLSRLFVNHGLLGFAICYIIPHLPLAIRYYMMINIIDIENDFLHKKKYKQKIDTTIVYFFMIAIPVLSFIFFRVYSFGRI